MLVNLHWEQLTTRKTNRCLNVFHKIINGLLSLPVGNRLQPTQLQRRLLHNKTFNTIHTSKDGYKFSYFPMTIKYWNSLLDTIISIIKPHHSTAIAPYPCALSRDRFTPEECWPVSYRRQDKTRQDKTRQDKTRQDKTRQDKTRQDKAKARQGKARQGKA